MYVTVGRIGRPHGIRGEVTVEVHTDDPDERFATGSVLDTDTDRAPRLTVAGTRWHQQRLLVTFAEVTDRTQAEGLRGAELGCEIEPGEEDPDAWYDQELVGLRARYAPGTARAGETVGEVSAVLHLPAQDLLEIRTPRGAKVLVPFVAAIVPEVDPRAGEVLLDPPPGLVPGDGDAVDAGGSDAGGEPR